jgi:serine acetyltransferase
MTARELAKALAFGAATIAVAPSLLSFRIRAGVLGTDRALEGSTQMLSMVPGVLGQYVRRAFLTRVLAAFDRSATIEFGTIFSQADSRIDRNAYVGPRCYLGLVHIEEDVLIGAGVHIPSGPLTHGTAELGVPIREQPGAREMVTIGAGSWIGSGAIVLQNVGRDSVVAAGAIVTRPIPDRVVAAGVPARIVRHRDAAGAGSSA